MKYRPIEDLSRWVSIDNATTKTTNTATNQRYSKKKIFFDLDCHCDRTIESTGSWSKPQLLIFSSLLQVLVILFGILCAIYSFRLSTFDRLSPSRLPRLDPFYLENVRNWNFDNWWPFLEIDKVILNMRNCWITVWLECILWSTESYCVMLNNSSCV